MDLILRPSTMYKGKPWALQLRLHGPAETEYYTIAHVSEEIARDIVSAGQAFFLFGHPDKPWESSDRFRYDLKEMIEEAKAQYEALSPVDRALHDDEQRRSLVRVQSGHDPGPNVLAEEVRRLRAELGQAR